MHKGVKMDFKKLKIYITLKEYTPDGKLVKEHKQEANSLVGNFFGIFAFLSLGATGLPSGITVKDTGNTSRNSALSFYTFSAAATNSNFGIVVGTGNTAVAIGDYALATKIAHGTGATQLQYGAHTLGAITGTTSYAWTITRAFVNSSGGNIVIAETGLIGYVTYYILWERTVLASTFTVNNGNSCVAQYDFTFSLV